MFDANHFQLFELPERFAIDDSALESAWRRLQSAVHPDRHVQGSPTDRRLSLQRATQVNEAYRTLRDPLRRAAYLCELRGRPLQLESNTAMPPAFLMQQMEWREALDEARGGRDAQALSALREQIDAGHRALLETVRTSLDDTDDTAAAAAAVRQWMFLDRLAEEIDDAHEALLGA